MKNDAAKGKMWNTGKGSIDAKLTLAFPAAPRVNCVITDAWSGVKVGSGNMTFFLYDAAVSRFCSCRRKYIF